MNTCIKCGCDDAYPSLPPCPSPTACPNPPECAEVYPAECVVISLADIVCGVDVVVFQGDSIVAAIENIVTYFCEKLAKLTDYINAQLLIINNRLTTIEGDIILIELKLTSLTTAVNELTACCDTKQKFISTNYLLTSADDGYTIIITNGATPISITVPTGLSAKLQVGFIQDGTGDVTFTPSGTTLNNAISGYKIKGQYDQAYLEQGLTSSIYYLLGNTKV
jgi:hypothetical protein